MSCFLFSLLFPNEVTGVWGFSALFKSVITEVSPPSLMGWTLASSGSGLELSGIHPLDMGEVSRSHPCITPAPKTWPHNSTSFSQLLQPCDRGGLILSSSTCWILFSSFPHPLLLWCGSKSVFSLQTFISCVCPESHSQLLLVSPLIKHSLLPAFVLSATPAGGLNLGQLVGAQSNRITHSEMRGNYHLNWQLSSCLFPFLPCVLMTRHVVSCSISFQASTSQRVTEKWVQSHLNLDSSSSLPLGPSRLEREAHTPTVA